MVLTIYVYVVVDCARTKTQHRTRTQEYKHSAGHQRNHNHRIVCSHTADKSKLSNHLPSDQHRVQNNAQRPHVRRFARVRCVDAQYFGRHVRRTAALVLHNVFGRILENDGIFEGLEPELGAANGNGGGGKERRMFSQRSRSRL